MTQNKIYSCNIKNNILTPMQPLMVFVSSKYYKMPVMNYGISQFYRYKVSHEMIKNVQIVPDCSVDIVFRLYENKAKAVCYGSPLKLHDVSYISEMASDDTEIFGVRLMPDNIIMPGGCPVSKLTNNGVSFSDLIKNNSNLIERICESKDFYEQVSIFMEFYLNEYEKCLIKQKTNNITKFVVDEIVKSYGNVKVEELSIKTRFTTRYINKLFNEAFGMSPKIFSKIIRFQGMLTELDKDNSIIDASEKMGYFDQSHLGKEFKKFMGTTPKKYEKVINDEEYKNRLIVVK